MTMTLRRGGAADGPTLAQVFHASVMRGAAGAYSAAERAAWAGPEPAPLGWAERTAEVEVWLAERGSVVTGFAGLAGDEFDLLYVHPDHMGKGVGGALYDHILNRAQAAGQVALTTYASHVARPFFEARGWHVVGENRVCRRGVWLSNTRLRLSIPSRP